jgi:hypothetical protein
MFLALTVASRSSLRWRFAPFWTRITAHKRLVLALAVCGALAGILLSAATSRVYAARVVIRIDTSQPGCGGFSVLRPLPVRIASHIDAAVIWLNLPSPKLEDRVSKWTDNR